MGVNSNYIALVKIKVSDTELKKQIENASAKVKPIKIKVDAKEVGNAGKEVKSLGQSFAETTEKVLRFGLSTKIILGFRQAIEESVETVYDFDRALTEFKKVSDLNGEALDNYIDKLGKMGEEVARTRTEMLESATNFKKSGFSEEDSAQLAKLSELYKNIADTQVTSGESSSFLISQMKSFNFTAEDTIKILDSMNNIANHMAVGTNDLQLALEKSGSALGTLGNSFQESIALVESGTAIMQNQGSKVGRGLKRSNLLYFLTL